MSRPRETDAAVTVVMAALERHGLLLASGAEYPSVTTLVCGEPIHGSWWSHPKGSLIHWVLEALDAHEDATSAKLIAGKVTYAHRRLWSSLAALGQSRAGWRPRPTPLEHAILRRAARGPFLLNAFRPRTPGNVGAALSRLERRLAVHTAEEHTESGRHTRRVQTWRSWWLQAGHGSPLPHPDEAARRIEACIGNHAVRLPWQRVQTQRTRRGEM